MVHLLNFTCKVVVSGRCPSFCPEPGRKGKGTNQEPKRRRVPHGSAARDLPWDRAKQRQINSTSAIDKISFWFIVPLHQLPRIETCGPAEAPCRSPGGRARVRNLSQTNQQHNIPFILKEIFCEPSLPVSLTNGPHGPAVPSIL